MKLHDPAEEREFLRIASQARVGRPLEAGEPPPYGAFFGELLLLAFTWGIITRLLLGRSNEGLDGHWWELIACLALMLTATWSSDRLNGTAVECGVDSVLPNLPISGERAMRWILGRFCMTHFWKVVCICAVISMTADGATKNVWMLAGNITLLATITASTMMLMGDEWVRRLMVTRVWFHLWLVGVGLLVWLFIFRHRFLLPGGSPEWIANVARGITWAFPPSWAMRGRFENGGAWLCTLWIAWGFWKWMIWPRVTGRAFDQPQDRLVGFADEDDLENEDDMAELLQEIEADIEESSPSKNHNEPLTLPAPLAMKKAGWVDRWVDAVIGERCRLHAGALCAPHLTWTKQTMRLLKIAPFWLLMAWLIVKWFPNTETQEKILLWIWIIPLGSAIYFLLPFSNAIARAMDLCGAGMQQMPFFSGLPVNTRDLLRLSSHITLARSLVMAVIAGFFFSALWMISAPGIPPWHVLAIVLYLAVFWIFSRPVFITYRLKSASRRRHGVALLNTAAVLISVLLCILWFSGGAVGVVACFALFSGELADGEVGLTHKLAFGGLIGSALCARAVFEILQWQVRRRHFDWLHTP
jgi:hypothetical protein